MKILMIATILFVTQITFAQVDGYIETDTVIFSSEFSIESNTSVLVTQQTGHFNALVLIIGFPDRVISWPTINNNANYPNEYFPKLGTYPNGITLRDEIATNGPVFAADWYKDTIEDFFNIESSGNCTVSITIPQMNNGTVPQTTKTFSEWISSNTNSIKTENVVYNQYRQMIGEALSNLLTEQPQILVGIDIVCGVFQDVSKSEYHVSHLSSGDIHYTGLAYPGGITIYDPNSSSQLFSGPLNHQRVFDVLPHEILHIFGRALNPANTFQGLPDRGDDRPQKISSTQPDHYNLTWGYDMMYHSGQFPALTSLYGMVPLSIYDKTALGWIEPSEILEIRNNDELNIKLYDVNDKLNVNESGYRVIKIYIDENYSGDYDEYFLVEYRDGSKFDKNFYNYFENQIETGITIWHIKEKTTLNVGFSDDQLIDIELATPYNGWEGRTPQPDDGYYYATYNRQLNYNGNLSQEFDYLDDLQKQSSFITDGGVHFWENRISPTNPVQFIERTQPLKSNFYSDDVLQGKKLDKFTVATYPSTCKWTGENTYIAITEIKRENGYMSLNVKFNYWEGEITENKTLSGNVKVGSNLTVASGVTLTVDEGTDITFENGSALIVNGTLNISGTTTNKVIFDFIAQNSTLKNGIKVNAGGVANISNAEIRNAYTGIYVNGGSANIDNCLIRNGYSGIHLYGSNSVANITNTRIYEETVGIDMYYSNATLSYSEIDNNYIGISCYNASPLLATADYNGSSNGYNNIHTNTFGIMASYNSNPFLGRVTCEIFGGNNIIDLNTTKDINLNSYCTVYAENNWWGGGSGSYYKGTGCYIYDIPFLTSPPQMSQNKIKITPEEEEFNKKFIPQVTSSANSTESLSLVTSTNDKPNYNDKWSIEWKLLYARNLIRLKKYNVAADICESVITEFPDSARSYLALDLLWQARKNDNKTLFNQFVDYKAKSKVKKQLFGAAEIMLALDQKESRISTLEKIEAKYTDTPLIEHVLFSKFMYYLYEENNIELAKTTADELGKLYPESESYYASQRHLGNDVVKPTEQLLAKEAVNEATTEIPQTYELLGNYPNPFNPSTTIKYALPYSSDVELTIYDITGKVITTLNRNGQSAGYQNIVWNGNSQQGSRVSSGVYFYRFKATSIDGSNKVFEKTAKMLMLK